MCREEAVTPLERKQKDFMELVFKFEFLKGAVFGYLVLAWNKDHLKFRKQWK
jgi:hypothetical protein